MGKIRKADLDSEASFKVLMLSQHTPGEIAFVL